MTPVETIEIDGYRVNIYPDLDAEDPREWDNLGTMVCFHKRYNLGDKHNFTVEELQEYVERDDVIALPLYMYDHSGIGISTNNSSYPYNCPWDSGQLGYIVVELDKVCKEFGWKTFTEENRKKVIQQLQGEVETYHQYVSGDVWGFVIEVKKDCGYYHPLDSCFGFYGSDFEENGLMDEARSFIKTYIGKKSDKQTVC